MCSAHREPWVAEPCCTAVTVCRHRGMNARTRMWLFVSSMRQRCAKKGEIPDPRHICGYVRTRVHEHVFRKVFLPIQESYKPPSFEAPIVAGTGRGECTHDRARTCLLTITPTNITQLGSMILVMILINLAITISDVPARASFTAIVMLSRHSTMPNCVRDTKAPIC